MNAGLRIMILYSYNIYVCLPSLQQTISLEDDLIRRTFPGDDLIWGRPHHVTTSQGDDFADE